MENSSDLNFIYVSSEVTQIDWTVFEITSLSTSSSTPSEASVIDFTHRAIVASVLIVVAVIGLFGNALVIISVVIAKKLRTITNVLVVNLAFADFISSSIIPFQSVGLISQTGRYPLHEMVCATVAGVAYIVVCCSVWTLVAIAFVRWYVITKSIRGHQGIHTPKKIATVVGAIWIWSIAVMIVPPVLEVGTLGYSEYYSICSLTDTDPLNKYYVMLQGTLVAIALLLTLIFYLLILRHVLQHNKRFRDKFGVDNDGSSDQSQISSITTDSRPHMIKAIKQKEVEITKNLFMVVCVFILCFLASVINFIIPGRSIFTLYSTMILLLNSVVNPIIYSLKHPNFQDVFKKILCCRRTH